LMVMWVKRIRNSCPLLTKKECESPPNISVTINLNWSNIN
jgi:hypothetical protein